VAYWTTTVIKKHVFTSNNALLFIKMATKYNLKQDRQCTYKVTWE